MTERSRSLQVATAVTAVLAAVVVALAGPSFASAAPLAKPAQEESKAPSKPKENAPPPSVESKGKPSAKAGDGEGIVQSVSATTIVLRELDGSTASVPVAANTRVFVDGKRASLGDVKPGFVALAAWKAGKPAHVLQVFDLSGPNAVKVGVVDSVSARLLVVTETGGTTLSIPVNAKTHVLVDGKPAKLAAVKAGYTVVIAAKGSKGNKPPHELRFLRPG